MQLIELKFFKAYTSLKPHILFYSNGLPIWHGFPDITHIEINNSRKSAILNLIKLNFFRAYHSLKHTMCNMKKIRPWVFEICSGNEKVDRWTGIATSSLKKVFKPPETSIKICSIKICLNFCEFCFWVFSQSLEFTNFPFSLVAQRYYNKNYREILELANLSSSQKVKPREYYQIYGITFEIIPSTMSG